MRILISILFFFTPIQLLFAQNNKIVDFHKDKAIDELMRGNKQIALIEINEALNLNPKNADCYYIRGMILEKMNDFNKALTDYKKTLDLNPKHKDATMKCGIMYAKLNDKSKACEYLKMACELGEPKACEGYYCVYSN